jgi:hypothetical protein
MTTTSDDADEDDCDSDDNNTNDNDAGDGNNDNGEVEHDGESVGPVPFSAQYLICRPVQTDRQTD